MGAFTKPTGAASWGTLAERLEPRHLLSADLTGAFAGAVPEQLLPVGSNRLTLKLSNQGDASAAGSVQVALYASTDATLDAADAPLLRAPVTRGVRLAPGKATTVPLRFAIPSALPDGTYTIFAQITPAAAIGDTDAADKAIAAPHTVQARQPFVDLTATVTRVSPPLVHVGKKQPASTAVVRVTNGGNVAAKGKADLAIYASTVQLDQPGGTLLARTPLRRVAIPVGRSVNMAVSGKVAATTPSGTFYIGALVNADQTMVESDYGNDLGWSSAQVTFDNPAVPPGPTLGGAIESDVTTALVGDAAEVVNFNLPVTGADASTTVAVDEFDAQGNNLGLFTNLYDDGDPTHGDQTAGDGTYSGTNTVGFTAPGTRYFAAVVTDDNLATPLQSANIAINGVTPPSTEQLQTDTDVGTAADQAAQNVIAAGGTEASAIAAANAALVSNPDVQATSIATSDHAIAWLTTDGIPEVLDLSTSTTDATLKGGDGAATPAVTPIDSVQPQDATTTTTDPTKKAVVISPFTFSFGQFDEGPLIRDQLTNAGYQVTPYINGSSTDTTVTLDSFKTLGQYAAVVISTHGALLPNPTGDSIFPYKGEALVTGVKATTGAELANLRDLYNGRLVVTAAGEFAITNKFIRTYTGSMNGSIVYVGSCFSTFDDQLASSFIARGAEAFLGYNLPVNSDFSATEGVQTFRTLLNTDPTQNQVKDIPGLHTTDPDAPHALFEVYGNAEARLPQPDLLSNVEVYVRYDWPQNQSDLDSATGFLGARAGFDQPGGAYLDWSGDDTGSGGEETTLVDVGQAYVDGKWTTSTTVTAAAAWYEPAGGSGPALLTVALENKTTGQITNETVRSINPGTETDGAATTVATITVTLGGDAANPTVVLSVG